MLYKDVYYVYGHMGNGYIDKYASNIVIALVLEYRRRYLVPTIYLIENSKINGNR